MTESRFDRARFEETLTNLTNDKKKIEGGSL